MARNASNIKAGGAYVELTAKDGKLSAGLKSAEAKLARFGAATKLLQVKLNSISRGFAIAAQDVNNVSNGLMSAGGKIFGVAALMGGALGYAIKQSMDLGEALDKMSGRTGASVEWLSAMRYAADMSGATIEEVENALKGLNETYAEASIGRGRGLVWLKELGVDLAELENLNTEEKFERIADAISKVDDAAKRTKYATGIFRGGGEKLLPMIGNAEYNVVFNTDGAENSLKELGLDANKLLELKPEVRLAEVRRALEQVDNEQKRKKLTKNLIVRKPGSIEQAKGEAQKLGLIVSTEQSKNAAKLNDALGRLKMTMNMLLVQVGNALTPSLKTVTEEIAGLIPTISDFIAENKGTVVSLAKLIPILTGAGLGIMALGVLLKPVVWAFTALSLGFAGMSKIIGGAILSFKIFAKAGSVIGSTISGIGSAIRKIIPIIGSIGKSVGGTILSVFSGIGTGIIDMLRFSTNAIYNFAAGVYAAIKSMVSGVISLIPGMVSFVSNSLEYIYTNMIMVLRAGLGFVTNAIIIFQSAFVAILTVTTIILPKILAIAGAGVVLYGVFIVFKNLLVTLPQIFSVFINAIKSGITGVMQIIKGLVNVAKNVFDFFVQQAKKLVDVVVWGFQSAIKSIANLFNQIVNIGVDAWETIRIAFTSGNLADGAKYGLLSIKDIFLTMQKQAIEMMQNIARYFFDTWWYIGETGALAIVWVIHTSKSLWQGMIGWLAKAMDLSWIAIKHAGINAIGFIADAFRKGTNNIAGFFIKLFAELKKGWIRTKGLFSDIDVKLEIEKIDAETKQSIDALDAENKNISANREGVRAGQKQEAQDVSNWHDNKNKNEKQALSEEYKSEQKRVKNNAKKLMGNFNLFDGILAEIDIKLQLNEEEKQKLKEEIERIACERSYTIDTDIADKNNPYINLPKSLDGIMGSFQLKDLSFFGGEKNNDMTTHQKQQIELAKRANRILEGIAARKQSLSFL